MSRNATASWSGYGYQGNVGLLVALRKINSLRGRNLGNYNVDYESQEDVRLLENGVAIEVHQVKAYANSDTMGSYTTALRDFETCTGSNYLHTVCNIRNWDDAKNPKNIIRYPYGTHANYCSLADIRTYIDSEIQNILQRNNHDQAENGNYRNQLYTELLSLLDERIRDEHQHGSKTTYSISFTLTEINTLVITNLTNAKSLLHAIRHGLFTSYEFFLEQLEEDGTTLDKTTVEYCEDIIIGISYLEDTELIQLLENINPHTTEGKTFAQTVLSSDYFVAETFKDVFIYSLWHIATKIDLTDKTFPLYAKGHKFVLSSIQGTDFSLARNAARILSNPKFSKKLFDIDYIINESYDGSLNTIANKLVTKDPRKFFNANDVKFITKTTAIIDLQ